jgi:hypothetical protein
VFVRDLNLGDKVAIMDDANLPVVTVVSLDEDEKQTSDEEATATTTTD